MTKHKSLMPPTPAVEVLREERKLQIGRKIPGQAGRKTQVTLHPPTPLPKIRDKLEYMSEKALTALKCV